MNLWKQFSLSRLFRRTSATRSVKPQRHAERFRPSLLALEDRTVPTADLFANATLLTGTFASDTGSNVGATAEVGEPAHPTEFGTINSVWAQWTAPASGTVEINTFGSDFDTLLAVYTGSTVNALTLVADNDDANSSQSQVLFTVTAGTTYRIAVDGFADATGNIVLNLGMTQPNDNFANATVVAGGTVFGSNAASTSETGEPAAFGTSTPINSVWWSWTPTTTGAVSINTFGSTFDTQLAVYTGTAVNALLLVTANDDSGGLQSQVTFNAVAGTTYRIAVDGFLNETGTITLTFPAAPPSNSPPVIGNQSFSVNENSVGGVDVGTVLASDPDAGQTLSYAIIAGNTGNAFTINLTTGLIEVASGASLNYEALSSYSLTVQVTDNGSPSQSASATVTINLNNVNENPVVNNQTFGVAENSTAGTVVGSVTATDPDAGQTLSFAIVGGNTGGAFAINSVTGQITVVNPGALDFETNPVFTLTVQVTDNGSPNLSSTATVTINLSDVNETPEYRINLLKGDVQALVNSNVLTTSQGNELLAKLNTALRKLEEGNVNAAINNLNAFVNKLHSYVSLGILTPAQANPLIAEANDLIDDLS